MVTINVYDKGQVDDLLTDKMDSVDTTGASEGDVLTLDANLAPIWQAGGSSGMTAHTYSTAAELKQALIDHPIGILITNSYLADDYYMSLGTVISHYISGSSVFMGCVYQPVPSGSNVIGILSCNTSSAGSSGYIQVYVRRYSFSPTPSQDFGGYKQFPIANLTYYY